MLNALLLSLFLAVLVPDCNSEKAVQYKRCRQTCKDFLEDEFKKSNICQGAHNIKPKQASVHKACMKGKFMGFEHVCMPTCMYEEYRGSEVKPGNSYEACKTFWKRPRPNNELPWCRRGYDYAYEVVKNEIVSKRNYLLVENGIHKQAEVEKNHMIQEKVGVVDPGRIESTIATEEKKKSGKDETSFEANIYNNHFHIESVESVLSKQIESSSNDFIKEVVNGNTDPSITTNPTKDMIGEEMRDEETVSVGDENQDEESKYSSSFAPNEYLGNSNDMANSKDLSNFDEEITNPHEF